MKVRCQNCHTEWDVTFPADTSQLRVICPACELSQNVDERGHSVGEGGGSQTLSRQWMVRKGKKQIYGPFPEDTLHQWIAEKQISATDEVAEVGGGWVQFSKHPSFYRLFPEVAPAFAPRAEKSEASLAREKALARWMVRLAAFGRGVLALVGIAAIGAATWWAVTTRALVVPEVWVVHARTFVAEQRQRYFPEKSPEVNQAQREVDKIVADLAATHGTVRDSSQRLRLWGRTLLLRDDPSEADLAQAALEKAVVLNPSDPLSLAALGELYVLRAMDPAYASLGERASRLIALALELEPESTDVVRAHAAMLIATRKLIEGRGLLDKILERNPADTPAAWLYGLSLLREPDTNPEKALPMLKRAAEMNPRLPGVQSLLGRAHLLLRNYGQALESYRTRTELSPTNSKAWYELGRAWLEVGDGPRAWEHLRKAASLGGADHPLSLLYAGAVALQHTGELQEAKRLLSAAVQSGTFPELPMDERIRAHVFLSQTLRLSGELELAADQARAALKMRKAVPEALFALGMIEAAKGRSEPALELLTQALAEDVDARQRSRIRYAIGSISWQANRMREAVSSFADAVDNDKHHLDAYLALAAVYVDLGQISECHSTLDALARQDPEMGRLRRFRLDEFYFPRQLGPRILSTLQRTGQQQFFVSDALSAVGIALYHAGQYGQAAQWLGKALQVEPTHARSAFYLGASMVADDNPRGGLPWLKIAADRGGNSPTFHSVLGRTLLRVGQVSEASIALQAAARRDSRDPAVQLGLALLEIAQGNRGAARQALLTALDVDPTFVAAKAQIARLGL